MIYKETKPDKSLRTFIHSYWKFEIHPSVHKKPFQHSALVDGCASLVFSHIPGQPAIEPLFWGPATQNCEVEVHPGAVYAGVRFMPSQTAALFGKSGIELRDQAFPAGDCLKNLNVQPIWKTLKEKEDVFIEFDKVFNHFISNTSVKQNYAVLNAVQRIMDCDGNTSLGELTEASPMSKRHLQRQFKKWVGLTIKEFCRVRRIRSTVIQMMISGQRKPGFIHSNGFYDRAHFNHEFSLIIRQTPSQYQAYIDEIVHQIDSK